MLTPEKIQALADPIETIYQRISDELIINIGKHIRAPTWTHTAAWEVQKLSELGQLTAENAAIINTWIKDIPKAAREAMTETRRAALLELEKQMEAAVAAGKVSAPVADSTVNALQTLAAQAVEKYNLVNTTMLESSADLYAKAVLDVARDTINDAAAAATVGTKTRRQAIRDAMLRIGGHGITGFIDRAGRSWTPEAYVSMVTRTTVHTAAIEARKAFAQDYGSSVFQVSSHAGARPGCYPFQGKFYSWDNTSGEIELGDWRRVHYEPISSTTYGEPAGLFGINCGHYDIPVIPGVSIPHGSDNIQPPEVNKRQYEESQEQRRLERNIREAKRDVEALGDLATKEDRARIRAAQTEMREFIERTGRGRRYDREQIGG